MFRRTAAAVGKSRTERALGCDLFDLPCPGRPRSDKGGSGSDPGGSRAQQTAASLSEITQIPISPAFQATAIYREFSDDTRFSPAGPATSISFASFCAIASANELKSWTTSRKALVPPITFCR